MWWLLPIICPRQAPGPFLSRRIPGPLWWTVLSLLGWKCHLFCLYLYFNRNYLRILVLGVFVFVFLHLKFRVVILALMGIFPRSVSHLLSPPCTIISRTSFPWSLVYSLANIFTHPGWCCGHEDAGKIGHLLFPEWEALKSPSLISSLALRQSSSWARSKVRMTSHHSGKKKDLMEQIYFCSIQLYFQGHHPWQSVVIGDLQWYVKSDRSLQQFYLRACEGCLFPQILELPGSGLNERTSWSCHLWLRIRSRLWWSILVPGASVKPAQCTEQFFRVRRRRSGANRGRRENFRWNCS